MSANALAYPDDPKNELPFFKLPPFRLEKYLDGSESYAMDAAVDLLGSIHHALETVEDYKLKLRWCIGHVLIRIERPMVRLAT